MLLTEWNWDDDHRMALAEGREEGREEGRVEGRTETKAEDVRNLSNYGMQPAAIASALKLPMEDVQQYLTAV
jgi:predicted transposase/invertase (TIGR01784 family)